MNTEKIFSIVIPTYNSVKTICETLDSLATLDGKEALDVVISDDGSRDQTIAIVKDWMGRHRADFDEVVLLENAAQQGISGNHKVAFDHVKSRYAMYMGADDLIARPDLVSNLNTLLATRAIVIGKMRVEALYRPGDRVVDMYGAIEHFFRLSAKKQFAALSIFGNFLYAGPGTILDVNILRRIRGFDSRFRSFEDYGLFLNFLRNGFRIELLDVKGLYWVRSIHSLSATGFGGSEKQFASDLELLNKEYVEKHMALLSIPARLLYRMKKHHFIFKVFKKMNRMIFGFPR